MRNVSFDVIVVGLGAMGSAAAYHLASRGRRVLGLDAHPAGHTLGSSHGETRIIRMAYWEHPNYVPLVRRAYALWDQLERDADAHLLQITGGLFIGEPNSDVVKGSRLSAEQHGLPHAMLDAAEIRARYPVFEAGSDHVALFEERAGVLFSERCIEAHLTLAGKAGAELHDSEPVRRWSARGDTVTVETDVARYTAERLVVAVGAWAGKLAGLPIRAERIPLYWFEPLRDVGEVPIWIWGTEEGDFFGTPHFEWPGFKVGKHHSATYVDPDIVDRDIHAADEAPIRVFLSEKMPRLNGTVAQARVCLYENSPDTDFLIDVVPDQPNVIYAAGFSGHGFKFASVVGEILADMATTGVATPDAQFLRAARAQRPTSR
jgi:sarcosine oxidase